MFKFSTTEQKRQRGVFVQTDIKRRGIAYIWAAIFLIIFILLAGLSFDAARAFVAAHQLQNAADAAALAGACLVRVSEPNARQKAIDIAYENFVIGARVRLDKNEDNADPDNGDIIVGIYDRSSKTFIPTTTDPNAVKVIAKRTEDSLNGSLPLIFGPIAGVNDVDITRSAIAVSIGTTGAGLITLDKCCGLTTDGTKVSLDVNNDGAIQINADGHCSKYVKFASCPDITAAAFNVVDISFTDVCLNDADFPDGVNAGVPRIEDPLCPGGPGSLPCLPEPSAGIHHTGLTIKNGETLTLEPGVHIIDGGLIVNNGGTLIANNVMLFIQTGILDVKGQIIITPPESGTYEGVAIFQSRSNPEEASIGSSSGSSGIYVEGTLYFPNNTLSVTSNDATTLVGNQLIVGCLELIGNSSFIINYDGRNPVPALKSFLVR